VENTEAPLVPVPAPAGTVTAAFTGKAARDGAWVLSAQGIGVLIALGIDSLLFHMLSKDERGIFSASRGLQDVLLLFCDLGIALTTIRVGSQYHAKGLLAEANLVFKRALITRLILAIGLSFLAFFLAPGLVKYPLAAGNRVQLVWAGAASLLAVSIIAWAADVAQARRQFGAYFAQQVVAAAVRGWILLIVTKRLTMDFVESGLLFSETLLWAMAAAACLVALLCAFIQRDALLELPGLTPERAREVHDELSRFGRYAAATVLLAGLSGYVEIFLLQSLLKPADTAAFEGARRLALILPLLSGAVTTVLLPRAAALDSPQACITYARKALAVSLPMAIVAAGGLAALAGVAVPIFCGDRYGDSIPALRWLCVGFAFNILLNPVTLLLYPLRREGTVVLLLALTLILSLSGGFALIPRFGILGAAWSVAAVKALIMSLSGLIVLYYLRASVRAASPS
jgi:O-antigen/teichoic acid export membrane protein